MPVVYKKNIDNNSTLSLWEITEDEDTLLQSIELDSSELENISSYKSIQKRLQVLAVRNLIYDVTGKHHRVTHNLDGKPFLSDSGLEISITHTQNFAGILISKSKTPGLDAEFQSQRIERIAGKFMSDDEMSALAADNRAFHLYLHWCAKEVITKIVGKKNLNFADEIRVKPFVPAMNGSFMVELILPGKIEKIQMQYFTYKNFIIVWSLAELKF